MAITRAEQAKQMLQSGGEVLGPLGENNLTNQLSPGIVSKVVPNIGRGLAFILSGGLSGGVSAVAEELAKQKILDEAAKKAGDVIRPRLLTQVMQEDNRARGIGGYQSDFAQDSDFMGGKGTAAEMGSFAEGGRIGLQEGGGIEQRLEQLGGDVTSAEQMLQGINKRLQSAESSLGSGGGIGGLASSVQTPDPFFGKKPLGADNPLLRPGADAQPINFFNADLPDRLIPIDPYARTQLAGLSKDGQRFDSAQSAFDALAEQTRKAREINPFTRDMIGTELFQGAEGFKNFTNMFNRINDPSYVAPSLQLASQGSLGIPAAGYADGGNVVGGEFDFESARQMYGLGKLVKKVTRTVKKIAKSPVGKAALLYVGGAGLGALGTGTGFAGFKAGLMSPSLMFKNLATSGKGFLTGISRGAIQFPGAAVASNAPGAFKLGQFLTTGKGIGTAITAASLLPLLGIGTGEETEEEAEELIRGSGLDINAIRANPNQFLARRFRAEGGSMKEPVAKKTMPLLDLDGKEMDLRAEGGFVPIGRMEKADDVPARLSKNEFVFTADAVRNAGDGDVDKGAEVMYNMMKNLESGGDVSEESQGLKGARKMFQTSQRLEEVL